MSEPDHIFTFSDITDGSCRAHFFNCQASEKHEIRVEIDDDEMARLSRRRMPAPLADLADLALAVYVADRLSIRRGGMPRRIHVILPVRHPEILGATRVVDEVQDLLFWYTGDNWSFEFTRRIAYGRLAERQASFLHIAGTRDTCEVALWSGGLDSLAGLCYRMRRSEPAGNYTIFGTGGNTFIHHVQRHVADAARSDFKERTNHSINLVQVPIRTGSTARLRKNSTPRARGFVFLLLRKR